MFFGQQSLYQQLAYVWLVPFVLWKETTLKLPSCECCGHVFAENEKAYMRVVPGKVRVMQFGNPKLVDLREKPRYRCKACYDALWH